MRTLITTLVLALAAPALAQEAEAPAEEGLSDAQKDALLEELLRERAARQAEEEQARAAAEAERAKQDAETREIARFETWKVAEKEIRYEAGMPVPEMYTRRKVIRKGPVIAGGTLLGVGYVAATLTAAIDSDVDGYNTLNALYAPVVGPWIAMGIDGTRGDLTHAGGWALGLDGVTQAVGMGLLVWGLVDRKDVLQKKPFSLSGVSAAPTEGGAKLGLSGTF